MKNFIFVFLCFVAFSSSAQTCMADTVFATNITATTASLNVVVPANANGSYSQNVYAAECVISYKRRLTTPIVWKYVPLQGLGLKTVNINSLLPSSLYDMRSRVYCSPTVSLLSVGKKFTTLPMLGATTEPIPDAVIDLQERTKNDTDLCGVLTSSPPQYYVRYRLLGEGMWNTRTVFDANITSFPDMIAGEVYEVVNCSRTVIVQH